MKLALVSILLLWPAAARDAHRPQYHLLPPSNWMNDAMGIHWNGEYHVFYLHNPDAPIWRQDKHWAHAVSRDLVHWRHLPHALWPVPDSPEKLCCQTGSLVVHDGVPTAVYTCAPGVCIATSEDGLRTWKRSPKNPVIPSSPDGLEVTGFRDPYVWKEGDHWYLLMASGTQNLGGTILLYRSKDLRRWEYLHPLLPGEGRGDVVWEVPGLFRLGGKSVLLYSPTKESRFTRYFAGDYSNHRFLPERRGKLDLGGYFYAATTFTDGEGRRIAIGWLKEGRSRDAAVKSGWSGSLSLPRVLSLAADGRLKTEPVVELRKLRNNHRQFGGITIAPSATGLLPRIEGRSVEIMAEFELGAADDVGLRVLRSPDGQEETLVGYSAVTKELYVDALKASRSPDAENRRTGETIRLPKPRRVKFHVFVDHSVVEAFVDGTAITSRVYPSLEQSRGIDLFAKGGTARLIALDIWDMRSIW